jgi:hypothetical protein
VQRAIYSRLVNGIFESLNSGPGQAVSLVDSLEQMSLKEKCCASD